MRKVRILAVLVPLLAIGGKVADSMLGNACYDLAKAEVQRFEHTLKDKALPLRHVEPHEGSNNPSSKGGVCWAVLHGRSCDRKTRETTN